MDKSTSFFIILLMIVSSIAPVISVHSLTSTSIMKNAMVQRPPIVISIGHSMEEEIAITELKGNFPYIEVYDFTDTIIPKILSSTFQPVIWVGHGNDDGVIINNQIITWNKLSEYTDLSKGKDYILACKSINILQFTSEDNTFVFNGNVDAIFGANYISYIIKQNIETKQNLFDKLFKRLKDLYNKKALPINLGKFEGTKLNFLNPSNSATDNEKSGNTAFFFFTVLSTFGLFISKEKIAVSGTIMKYLLTAWYYASRIILGASWLLKLHDLVINFQSWVSLYDFIKANVLEFVKTIIDYMKYLGGQSAFYKALIVVLGLSLAYTVFKLILQIGAAIATVGGATALKVLNAIVGWALYLFYLIRDVYDCDTKFSSSPGGFNC